KKYIEETNNNIYVTKYYLQNRYPSGKNSYNASNVFINEVRNNYKPKNLSFKKVGLIGSLDTNYKGIETVLKSMTLLNKDIKLEIVGNGPQEKWKRKIRKYNLSDRVSLIGALNQGKEIDDWFSTLDLYIQPSYTE